MANAKVVQHKATSYDTTDDPQTSMVIFDFFACDWEKLHIDIFLILSDHPYIQSTRHSHKRNHTPDIRRMI